jgi:hypothetical protein
VRRASQLRKFSEVQRRVQFSEDSESAQLEFSEEWPKTSVVQWDLVR